MRFKMADTSSVNRRILQISVCALLCEQGFSSASKMALETLTEMLQSYLRELGNSCKLNCELSARIKPTLSDVTVALVDMGADLDSLPSYGKRLNRIHVNNPLKSRVAPTPKALAAGTRQTRPPYIPVHLPPLPDPHSYIKTPAFRQSSKEYEAVREKYATQRKDIEKGLSKFLAKTAEMSSGICDGLDAASFPLLVIEPHGLSYLSAVGDFDELDLDNEPAKGPDTSGSQPATISIAESFDNPYLRPAKRARKSTQPS